MQKILSLKFFVLKKYYVKMYSVKNTKNIVLKKEKCSEKFWPKFPHRFYTFIQTELKTATGIYLKN